jgi:hypothetical protein
MCLLMPAKTVTAVNHALHRIRFTFHAVCVINVPMGKILLVSASRQMLRRTQGDLLSVMRELSGTSAPTCGVVPVLEESCG